MKLLTKEIRNKIPALYSQEDKGDEAVVHVKFFDPSGVGTWLATEANAVLRDGTEVPLNEAKEEDIEDVLFFGLVRIFETEYGYFTLNELKTVKGRFGLGMERDRHFEPRTIKEVRKQERMS